MNKYGNIKCAGCGSEDIKMVVGGDGLDNHSVKGEGSGFVVEVTLTCQNCGRVYPVCRVKDFFDVSDICP